MTMQLATVLRDRTASVSIPNLLANAEPSLIEGVETINGMPTLTVVMVTQ